jgi:putative ABC transport system permease protein
MAARRAMGRWAWRLFRREWRQQLLILALVAVAVAATVVGATVSTDNLPPADAGFGTAHDMATLQGSPTTVNGQIADLEHRFHAVDVIENQSLTIPGSIETYDLRAQDPDGAYGQPMLSLVSGRYPSAADQVALTQGLASTFGMSVGDTWHQGGRARTVVGIVENPQSLLDEFALVVPGQVTHPTTTTVLFDAFGVKASSIGDNVHAVGSNVTANPINPDTIVLALATLTMLLIVLVAIGGFSVLAQRRLRSIGMLGALGATDRDVRLMVRANGLVVGVVGALAGTVLGFVVWLLYRPHLESSSHHLIGLFQLPWTVIGVAVVLGVLATSIAASRPARTVARVPIVVALSGRPAPPKEVHRTAMPGLIALLVGTVCMVISGSNLNGGGGSATLPLLVGFVALVVAIVLLAPFCVDALARVARRAPIAVRLALRDLSRYRARSGPALAAISLGVMIAVVISVVASARYGNVLDYAGPNLTSSQLVVYTPTGSQGIPSSTRTPSASATSHARAVHEIANALGSHDVVKLEGVNAELDHLAPGRNWNGPLFVATPQLLRSFGIDPASIPRSADIVSMRPGLSSISEMALNLGLGTKGGPPPSTSNRYPCPHGTCVPNPVIAENSALPSGTSAPNTLITESAVHRYHLVVTTAGWFIQTPAPITASQINEARLTADAAGMTIETKNSQPTSSEVIGWATVFGVVLALGVLAMTVGLIRSETAADLRTLTATGASSGTRRVLSAATAGALGLLGALIGTAVAYLASAAWFRGNSLNGGLSSLLNAPGKELLIILIGMPLAAAAVGWVLAGRQPSAIAHQPLE